MDWKEAEAAQNIESMPKKSRRVFHGALWLQSKFWKELSASTM